MEVSLEDKKPGNTYHIDGTGFKITVPLTRCLQGLKEKHKSVAKVHQERFEHVKSEEGYLSFEQRLIIW